MCPKCGSRVASLWPQCAVPLLFLLTCLTLSTSAQQITLDSTHCPHTYGIVTHPTTGDVFVGCDTQGIVYVNATDGSSRQLITDNFGAPSPAGGRNLILLPQTDTLLAVVYYNGGQSIYLVTIPYPYITNSYTITQHGVSDLQQLVYDPISQLVYGFQSSQSSSYSNGVTVTYSQTYFVVMNVTTGVPITFNYLNAYSATYVRDLQVDPRGGILYFISDRSVMSFDTRSHLVSTVFTGNGVMQNTQSSVCAQPMGIAISGNDNDTMYLNCDNGLSKLSLSSVSTGARYLGQNCGFFDAQRHTLTVLPKSLVNDGGNEIIIGACNQYPQGEVALINSHTGDRTNLMYVSSPGYLTYTTIVPDYLWPSTSGVPKPAYIVYVGAAGYGNTYGVRVSVCRSDQSADGSGSLTSAPCASTLTCEPGYSGSAEYPTSMATCTQCYEGYYSSGGNRSLSCNYCPPGTSSPAGATSITQCTSCPFGQVNLFGPCIECSYGQEYRNISGYEGCFPCDAGSIRPTSPPTTACMACPPGSHQPNSGQTVCQVCLAGTAQSQFGSSGCEGCPTGSYSTSNSSACTACGSGSYGLVVNSTTASNCRLCTPGTEQQNDIGASCSPCAAGRFSSTGFAQCIACSPGTYQSSPGLGYCNECPSNSYGPIPGATSISQCVPCPPDTPLSPAGSGSVLQCQAPVCPDGNITLPSHAPCASLCPSGSYCKSGQQIACPPGTSNPLLGQSSAAACVPCTAGSYAAFSASSGCAQCPPGTYIDTGGAVGCSLCAANTYQPISGASSSTACLSCPSLTPLSAPGAVSVVQCTALTCPSGYWTANLSSPCGARCPRGSFCDHGMVTGCPAGSAGLLDGATSITDCTTCQPGTYTNAPGSSVCIPCAMGFYQPSPGASFCLPCSQNTYNPVLGASSGDSCLACPPTAPTSPTASVSVLQCSSPGCPDGRITLPNGIPCAAPCPVGSWCIAGTRQECPRGTYNPLVGQNTSTACIPCPLGSFTSYTASPICSACPPGTFTDSIGSGSCTPCPQNTWQPLDGATSSSACIACPPSSPLSPIGSSLSTQCFASVCPDGYRTTSSVVTCSSLCAPGTYCQRGQVLTCPAGTYNPIQGATNATYCLLCPVGSISTSVGSGRCDLCSAGTYADTPGSRICTPCPQNTYQPQLGAISNDQCITCPISTPYAPPGSVSYLSCTSPICVPGLYSVPNQEPCQQSCPEGSFCQSGQKILCPPGSYTDTQGRSTCAACGTGKFSASGARAASECIECPLSTYSSAAASSSCTPCPLGNTTHLAGSHSIADCISLVGCSGASVLTSDQLYCPLSSSSAISLSHLPQQAIDMVNAFLAQYHTESSAIHGAVNKGTTRNLAATAGSSTTQVIDPYATYAPTSDAPSLRISAFGDDATLSAWQATGTSSVDGDTTSRLDSSTVSTQALTIILVVGLVLAAVAVVLYRYMPPNLAWYLDQFSDEHSAKLNGWTTSVSKPSQFGAALSVAFICTAVVLSAYLASSPNLRRNTSLVPPSAVTAVGTANTNIEVTIRAYVGADSLTAMCPVYDSDTTTDGSSSTLLQLQQGFNQPVHVRTKPDVSTGACLVAVDCIGCSLGGQRSVLNFSLPYSAQLIEWELWMTSAAPHASSRLYGVLSQRPNELMDAAGQLSFSVIEARYTDTSGSTDVNGSGYEVDFTSYTTLASQPIDTFNGDTRVALSFTLTRSSIVYVVEISPTLSPLQLAMTVLTSITSLFGVYVLLFPYVIDHVLPTLKLRLGVVGAVEPDNKSSRKRRLLSCCSTRHVLKDEDEMHDDEDDSGGMVKDDTEKDAKRVRPVSVDRGGDVVPVHSSEIQMHGMASSNSPIRPAAAVVSSPSNDAPSTPSVANDGTVSAGSVMVHVHTVRVDQDAAGIASPVPLEARN